MAEDSAEPATERSGWVPPSVDRPVATFMIVAAVVVFGWVSLQQMPVDLMPELSYPTVTVRTQYAGAAPEEVEDAVTRPIEEYLGTVEGMIGMSSVSRAGSSDVVFRFAWNTDLDVAIQKIRERLSLITLPDGADPPLLLRYDPTLDPILEIAVVGEGIAPSDLRAYVEAEVERELEELEGVAMVRVTGGDEAIVRVAMQEHRLEAYGIDPATVVERLRTENVNVAGGRLFEGEIEYLVRTVNEFAALEDVRDVVIDVRGDAVVRIGDIATVTRDVREREVLTRVDGQASVEIAVFKDADANLVAVAESARRRVFGRASAASDGSGDEAPDLANASGSGDDDGAAGGEDAAEGVAGMLGPPRHLSALAPEGVRFEVLTDQSTYIRAAIDEVTRTAFLGGLAAVIVLFIFLRRPFATFVISLAIPLSVIATFAPLRLLGVSLNIMSLGGIALGIGMLVDNAIVVLESIVRCREEGDDEREAAIRGTREVAGAVSASTLTTVAVFFPIVFVQGIAGQLFGDLGVAVVLSLIASLVFALLFVPMMTVLPTRLARARTSPRAVLRDLLRLAAYSTFRTDLGWARRHVARGIWRVAYVAPVFAYALVRFVVGATAEFVVRAAAAVAVLAAALAGLLVGGAGWVLSKIIDYPLAGVALLLRGITAAYRVFLAGALRSGVFVVLIAAGCLYVAMQTWPTLGVQLIPELRQGVFTAEIQLPVGTRMEETEAVVQRIERRLAGHVDIERLAVFIGRDADDLDASEKGEHTAELTVVVARSGDDPRAEDRALDAVRAAVAVEPALQLEVSRPTLFSLADPIAVEVRGDRLDALQESATRVEEVVRATPGVADARSSARAGFPEIRVRFDRERLAALGLDVRTVAETVRAKVQGDVATELRTGERSVDVEVALARRDVADLDALRSMVVAFVRTDGDGTAAQAFSLTDGIASMLPSSGAVRPVRLSGVAEVIVARGPAEVRHVEGQRAAVITAGTSVLDLGSTVSALRVRLQDVPLADGQLIVVSGQSDEMEAARRSLALALLLAVFLVYVVMASNFESLLGPLVILLTIPLALVGVVGVLWWMSTPVSVVVLIGVIVLAGIVVNNAIVLVDYILTLRRRGLPKREAILEACAVRLRPVLITALTTVLGLLPMGFALGEGAEIRRPLAWVVIAGLAVGTLLTLVVIPVVYDLVVRGDPTPTPSVLDGS